MIVGPKKRNVHLTKKALYTLNLLIKICVLVFTVKKLFICQRFFKFQASCIVCEISSLFIFLEIKFAWLDLLKWLNTKKITFTNNIMSSMKLIDFLLSISVLFCFFKQPPQLCLGNKIFWFMIQRKKVCTNKHLFLVIPI